MKNRFNREFLPRRAKFENARAIEKDLRHEDMISRAELERVRQELKDQFVYLEKRVKILENKRKA